MLGRLASLSPTLKDKEIIFEKEAIVVQMVSDHIAHNLFRMDPKFQKRHQERERERRLSKDGRQHRPVRHEQLLNVGYAFKRLQRHYQPS